MKYNHAFIGYIMLLVISGCDKDPDTTLNQGPILSGFDDGIYILNEGGFGYGNAALGYYRLSDSTYIANVYAKENGKLGDVLQSGWVLRNTAYLVLNNSGTIKQINLDTGKELKKYAGLRSPRYILPVANGKLFISDLYAKDITVTDTLLSGKLGSIYVGGWTEGMVAHPNGFVYVCHRSGNRILKIDPVALRITDSIPCQTAPTTIAVDKKGRLWVMSSGDAVQKVAPAIEQWVPGEEQNRQVWQLPLSLAGLWPRMCMNNQRDQIYYLAGDVFAMDIEAIALPASPLIPAAGRNLYGLAYWSNLKGREELILTDALDYVQQGSVYRYQLSGQLINTFKAGVIPNGVLIR